MTDESRQLTFGSLFAGIGGFDLGFERAGMRCRWQVEIDPFCQRVLTERFPNVGQWDDVRTFPPSPTEDWSVDVVCGGFPCQGISSANYAGQGLADERSGLWTEYARIIRTLRPRYVVIENVDALTFRGLDAVLRDLARIGFDAEWQVIPASAIGAPHYRNRIFIVAYATGQRLEADEIFNRGSLKTAGQKQASRLRMWPGQCEYSPALPDRIRWMPDRELCRVADELPDQLDRYRVLGNGVVPPVIEWIGRLIVKDSANKG